MTLNSRIKKIRETECNGSTKDFAKILGVSSQAVSNYLREGYNVGREVIENILRKFPNINPSWLLIGDGEMLKPNNNTSNQTIIGNNNQQVRGTVSNSTIIGDNRGSSGMPKGSPKDSPPQGKKQDVIPLGDGTFIMQVPLVGKYAYAGYLENLGDMEYVENLPIVPFVVEHNAKGEYISFEVRGDSMDDGSRYAYVEGDILLCRELPPTLWQDCKLHIKDWDFVIVCKDGIILKQIAEHNLENKTITVHSLNSFYPDNLISLNDVSKIFNVIQSSKNRKKR
jgi:SOS-response transcriptional repressor LexA